MTASCIMEVRPNFPCNIRVANLAKTTVDVSAHMVLSVSSDGTVNIIDPEQIEKERQYTVGTVQTASDPPVLIDESANDPKHQRRLDEYY